LIPFQSLRFVILVLTWQCMGIRISIVRMLEDKFIFKFIQDMSNNNSYMIFYIFGFGSIHGFDYV